jgi:aspartate carbamoyltransferase catalytic subunit
MSASLLELKSLTAEKIARVFSLADRLSAEKPGDRDVFHQRRGLTAALVFFEPSTRTRMSFETACHREGLGPITLDGGVGTSLEKGETPEDTVLNIAAMNPSVMVIRCGDDLDLAAMAKKIRMPILNAGWGRIGHPTQALLDAYAIQKKRGQIAGQKVLLIGDIRHSRVAASHFELAQILGYEVALCGPESFLPEGKSHKTFSSLKEGLGWATVAMALRVQLERHPSGTDLSNYHEHWGLHSESLKALNAQALVMHPGPVNWGVEMSAEVAQDRRTIILDQVSGGVAIRQALIRLAFLQEVP